MKANPIGWFLCLAIAATASCGGSPGGDAGKDVGRDSADSSDLVPADVHDVADDFVRTDAADVAGGEDVLPDLDAPAPDDGGTLDVADTASEASGDATPEPGDACDGPECNPCPDDDLECTEAVRDDTATCIQVLMADWCLVDGACVEKGAKDPAHPCRTCQPEADTGAYVVAIGLACDDPTPCSPGGACTAQETCATISRPCEDNNACTYDYCIDGLCSHPHVASGTCDDGDKCTQLDHCEDGACVGTAKVCTQDNNVCTTDACNPDTGLCTRTFNTDPCDDYNWCTVSDTCSAGNCVGTARNCSDGTVCKKGVCIQQAGGTGFCRQDPDPGGACEDGNLCTANDMCGDDLICHPGGNRVCNDNNACTDDSCDSALGCVFTQHNRGCDDGDPCTVGDTCLLGLCKGTSKPCDDGNPCTDTSCYRGTCLYGAVANGTTCDDGDICSTGDRCVAGRCASTGVLACDDQDACTLDACVPFSGCRFTTRSCDDGNPCTDDRCDTAVGCLHTPNALGCDDLDACTLDDHCQDTVCLGTPKNCADTEPCTIDSCIGGTCIHTTAEGSCNDGNACTTGERCTAGKCQGGWTISCDDLEDCTADSCDPQTGCVHTPVEGPCDDGTVCTFDDHCLGGGCVGTPVSCDDGNPCTTDTCDPVFGCKNVNNNVLCDDGIPCTSGDQCSNGVCAGVNSFANPFSKGKTLVMTRNGTPGYGLDVDGVPSTCAPAPDCTDGIDNYFGKMGIFLDEQFAPDLARVVADGRLALLMEHEAPGPGTGPYVLNTVFGQLSAPLNCNPTTAGCNYRIFAADVVGDCTPRYSMSNATIVGSQLSAGGKEYQAEIYFSFCNYNSAPAAGCYLLPAVLKWAQVQATVTLDGSGKVVGGSGILAGAIDVKKLLLDIDTVPDKYFSPYARDVVVREINQRLCSGTECGDLDTDGKSGKDAASIGLPFTLVTGIVTDKL